MDGCEKEKRAVAESTFDLYDIQTVISDCSKVSILRNFFFFGARKS
jgi:hypothetical protein